MPKRLISQIIAGRSLYTATREMTVRMACRSMAERRIGALLVLDGVQIVGIFTERDALNKVLAGGLDPDATQVGEVMAASPMTIRADRPLSHALHLMFEGGFRHVPVVDDTGLPVGMVSARDALGQDIVDVEQDLRRMEELESSIGY